MMGFLALSRGPRRKMPADQPRFAVIIGQGRSGSTLILRLLNQVPGVRISGENARAIDHLQHFAECYRAAEKNRHSDFYKLAWLKPCTDRQIMAHLRQLFINLHGPGKLLGFKEIRYGYEPYEDFERSLEWLRDLLPGVCFILNTRATETAVNSEWWANDPQVSRKQLDDLREKFQRYHDSHRDCCYWMPYEELQPGSAILCGMFAFLNLDWKLEYEQPLDVVMR
jgi:hypothetical protein